VTGALRFGDFRIGTLVLIDGSVCRVTGTESDGAAVVLQAENGSGVSTTISLAELYARVCEGTAQSYDPIARPDAAANMPPVTLAFLSTAASIDWYHRMILLRGLLRVSGCSPRSASYQRAFSDTSRLLEWVRGQSGVSSSKTWSAKRLNDVLRNWRHHGGAIAALLVQCVPARRRRSTNASAKAFQDLVRATTKKLPNASIATIHRVAGAALRSRRAGPDAGSRV
jgi:hypothetical protein